MILSLRSKRSILLFNFCFFLYTLHSLYVYGSPSGWNRKFSFPTLFSFEWFERSNEDNWSVRWCQTGVSPQSSRMWQTVTPLSESRRQSSSCLPPNINLLVLWILQRPAFKNHLIWSGYHSVNGCLSSWEGIGSWQGYFMYASYFLLSVFLATSTRANLKEQNADLFLFYFFCRWYRRTMVIWIWLWARLKRRLCLWMLKALRTDKELST